MGYAILEKQGNIAVITISREKALNALNAEVLCDLEAVIDEVEADGDIYCAIITGAGEKSFVAGADISAMADMTAKEAETFSALGNRVFLKIENLRVPVIGAVGGFALGGGLELALACDFRIASENALLGLPETGLGIMPGYGGTQRLARVISPAKAKKMMFTGEKIKAQEALEIGLVEEVVTREQLMESAMKLAKDIAKNSPLGVQMAKRTCNRGLEMDMADAVLFEAEMFGKLFDTEDQKIGMNAFLNREKSVVFKNK